MGKLRYDKEKLEFVEDSHSFWYYVRKGALFLLKAVGVAVILYLLYSLIVTSSDDIRKQRETELMQREYDELNSKVDLLEKVVNDLQSKDERIYSDIFNTGFPEISFRVSDDSITSYAADTTFGASLVLHTKERIERVSSSFDNCEALLDEVLGFKDFSMEGIPSIIPIANISPSNIGASLGRKIHPFYKQLVFHDGMDLIAPVGTDVMATASGKVIKVERSKRNRGNVVEIDHLNGYVTTYSHLSDILVRKGQMVQAGKIIGRVGNTGTSFAPHLHYQVIFNGEPSDPMNYFISELDMNDYEDFLTVVLNTGQSLD